MPIKLFTNKATRLGLHHQVAVSRFCTLINPQSFIRLLIPFTLLAYIVPTHEAIKTRHHYHTGNS